MIIYSCITNSYDKIPDHYYDPDVRYVMFHDGTVKQEGPWEFIKLDTDIQCPRRLSAFPKINPDVYFEEGERTVWIDACYKRAMVYLEMKGDRDMLGLLMPSASGCTKQCASTTASLTASSCPHRRLRTFRSEGCRLSA